MEVSVDHVPIFCFKSLSARAILREHPQVKRQLWGGEFWEDGYFVRTVGDQVTAEVIQRRYCVISRGRGGGGIGRGRSSSAWKLAHQLKELRMRKLCSPAMTPKLLW